MNLEDVMLSELSQRKTNILLSLLCVESKKKTKLIDTEDRLRLVAARGRRCEVRDG